MQKNGSISNLNSATFKMLTRIWMCLPTPFEVTYTHMDVPPYPFEVTYNVEIEKGRHPDCTPRVEKWCYIVNYKPLNNMTTKEKETKDFGFRAIF